MDNKHLCYVYWIHRKCESDIFTQGYVGITNNFKKRFRDHRKAASNFKKNHALYNSMKKYDDFIFDVVLLSTRDYCLDIESKLRPVGNIGLNHAPGGYFTRDNKTVNLGTIEKLRVASIEAHRRNPDLAKNHSILITGKPLTEQHKLNISKSNKGKCTGWRNSRAIQEVWKLAFDMYEKYKENPGITYYSLSKLFKLEVCQTQSILKSFNSGWNPFDDQEFIKYIHN